MNLTDKLAEALRAVQFGDRGYCSTCGGWMVGPNGCTKKSHTDDCPIRTALAEYAALQQPSAPAVTFRPITGAAVRLDDVLGDTERT